MDIKNLNESFRRLYEEACEDCEDELSFEDIDFDPSVEGELTEDKISPKDKRDRDDFYINRFRKTPKHESLDSDLSEYQKWVDYDMEKYHRISDITMKKIKKAGLSVVKDQYGEYEVIADRRYKKNESCLKEDYFEKYYNRAAEYLKNHPYPADMDPEDIAEEICDNEFGMDYYSSDSNITYACFCAAQDYLYKLDSDNEVDEWDDDLDEAKSFDFDKLNKKLHSNIKSNNESYFNKGKGQYYVYRDGESGIEYSFDRKKDALKYARELFDSTESDIEILFVPEEGDYELIWSNGEFLDL